MRILLLAGEESGVLYAERIRGEVLRRHPGAEIRGYGDYGFRTGDLAVMGLGQVICRLFYFLRVKRTLERAIREWRPDCVCTVDYPGLNLKLAAFAHARGIRAVHVVCPQVWAWKRGRIPRIEASLDRLCCFFPFEPALFRPGFAEFVGHPLVDEMRQGDGAGVRAGRGGRLLAILPGSRLGEIGKHLPVLLGAVAVLKAKLADLEVVIPAANDRAYARIASLLPPSQRCTVVRGGARDVLRRADAAIVASGTATLEAGLANCPTVVVYRVGWLFATIARRVITGVRHIGLVNVVAEKAGLACPMPELLQENLTVGNVVDRVFPLLADRAANEAARRELRATMGAFGTDGRAIARLADAVCDLRSSV